MSAPLAARAEGTDLPTELPELRALLVESLALLDDVPALLKAEKWVSRAGSTALVHPCS